MVATSRMTRTPRIPRATLAASAVLTLAATITVAAPAATASASSQIRASAAVFAEAMPMLQKDGLDVQESGGFLGAQGPAALVASASATLRLGGVGNTALYTGAGESGIGFVVISGNGVAPTTDFQVMAMTATSVENNSTQLDAVYSDDGSELDALVAPGTDADITPVDIDYAAYPVGSTPPPDNRGLNPDAQFIFAGGIVPLD